MRLGRTQKQIVEYLRQCGPDGGYIPNAPHADLLLGYTMEEVMRSAAALERRGVIRKLSRVRHALVPSNYVLDPISGCVSIATPE